MTTLMDRQLILEQTATDYSFNRLMKEINSRVRAGQADELAEGKMLLVHGIEAVADKLSEYFDKKIYGKMGQARDILAFEFYDTPKDLAFILLATIVRSISKDVQVPSLTLIRHIVKTLYESILVRRLDRSDTNFGSFVDKRFKNRSETFRTREKLKIIKRQSSLNDEDLTDITTYIGGTLLDLVIKSGINIIEIKNITTSQKRRMQYVIYTEECFKMVLQSRERLLADYRKFPIHIVKPKEWAGFSGTGAIIQISYMICLSLSAVWGL